MGVLAEEFRFLSGEADVVSFELPQRDRPPPYSVTFCRRCGSPAPRPPASGWFEIAAGLLDDDPGLVPDKHIYVEHQAAWHNITDRLPRFDKEQLRRHREREGHIEK